MNVVEEIRGILSELAETMGQKIPIPPLTGDMIERRRETKSKVFIHSELFLDKHTGWGGMQEKTQIDDLLTRLMLCEELAEMWDVPTSNMMCFDFAIYHEPARFYVVNRGIMPLVHEGKSTPGLLRAAWDGAYCGMWEVEDMMLTLPPPFHPLPPDADITVSTEEAAWFAGAK